MSNIKISELTEAKEANENDLLMIIQNGENKKIKASKVGTGKAGGGDTLPIGGIIAFDSDTIPNGWLLCDGRAVSRTEYAELFKAIGTKHGSGDGSTTFNLPNPKGRTLVGKDSSDTDFNELGKTGGEKTHTLTVDEMPSLTYDIQTANPNGSTPNGEYLGYGSNSDIKSRTYTSKITTNAGNQPHNNLQPYLVTNFIIKAKMTVAIEGEIIQEDGTASETNVYSSVAMDNKIQALKRVTLYENASGTNTTLTLNDSVANYEDIEIFYKSNDNAYSSVKVNNANNKNIILVNMTPNTTNNVLYVKATVVKAQNNSITVVDGLEGYGSGGITTGNKNYIVKVVGYKEV